MQDVAPFLRRQPAIIMLGIVAWLLAVWQLGVAAFSQNAVWYLLLIALNGVGPLLALLRLFWLLVATRRWQRDNRDPFVWGGLLLTYGSAALLAQHLRLSPGGGFYLVFLLVNMAPLLNRFATVLAIVIIVVSSLLVAVLQQALPAVPFGLYLLLGQGALWYMASSNIAEWQAHQETATAHAQLHATQQLLNEAVARNERTRIARDLHDQMGHHLVALNMQLQVLERKLPDDTARPELAQARQLARELFADVRSTVQQLRQKQACFAELLEKMLADIPYLNFEVEIDGELMYLDEQLATCLLRVVQEAITNSLKHSDASRLHIRLQQTDEGGLGLELQDNGRVHRLSDFSGGNGLAGLGERIRELGGVFEAGPAARGFRLRVDFPEESLS